MSVPSTLAAAGGSCDIWRRSKIPHSRTWARFLLDYVQFNNLLSLKPIKKLIYMCVLIYKWITFGHSYPPFCCVCLPFIIAVIFSPKYVTGILMYLWFVCCWRRTAGVWHTGKCKLSCCFTCSDLQIKAYFFHSIRCFTFFDSNTPRWPLGGRKPTLERWDLRKPEQNTIFIPYIQYIQCNTTRFSTHSLIWVYQP